MQAAVFMLTYCQRIIPEQARVEARAGTTQEVFRLLIQQHQREERY